MVKNLLLVGAGGHGKVAADTAIAMGQWNNIIFVDQRHRELGEIYNLPVVADDMTQLPYSPTDTDVVITIGNNEKRFSLQQQFEQAGFTMATLIHPSAIISSSVKIAPGSVVFPRAVINADAIINKAAIINTGAIVEHDCYLDEAVHISPHATLAGGVKVGAYSWIGIGSNVIQQVEIGTHVICGAGSTIINNVSDHQTVVGIVK